MENRDEHFMQKALMQAHVSLSKDEVPVGAIIVDKDGEIIARGHNTMEATGCQTGHAEVHATQLACKKVGDWRLEDCTIYVTLEPCLMCFGLIKLSRFARLVYGATSPLFGAGLDKKEAFPVYKKGLEIEGGVCSKESAALLKEFFRHRRSLQKEMK